MVCPGKAVEAWRAVLDQIVREEVGDATRSYMGSHSLTRKCISAG